MAAVSANSPVGFLGGGQMASALAGGFVASGTLQPTDLVFYDTNEDRRFHLVQQFQGCRIAEGFEGLFSSCHRIFLAVKPSVLATEMSAWHEHVDKKEHLLLSIAAGITLDQLQRGLGTHRVIRIMPNTPCLVGAGVCGLTPASGATESDVEWVESLLKSVGSVVRINESQMHGLIGISGSGPAFIFMMIEALADGGVAVGLTRQLAMELATQTVLGSAKMVQVTGKHPGELKDAVASPGGTTIAGIVQLEALGMRRAFIEAVRATHARSIEMSQ